MRKGREGVLAWQRTCEVGKTAGMNVLVLNSGSSSLKFQLIATDLERIKLDQDVRWLKGEVERIGGEAIITLQAQEARKTMTAPIRDMGAALDFVVRWIASDGIGWCTEESASRSRRSSPMTC